MKQYNDLIKDILENGQYKPNKRTGIGTYTVFGKQLRFDLQKEFPLVNSKKTNWKDSIIELLWYLRGESNVSYLHEHNIHIWDNWLKPGTNELGRVYGVQWRHWKTNKKQWISSSESINIEIDQIQNLIDTIKNNPSDRRMVVTAWRPDELDEMQLPPCHMTINCNVVNNKLNLHLLQRSCDAPIGLPWNLICYATLTHMLAQVCDIEVGEFIWTGIDIHIYENQIEQMKEMLKRTIIENNSKLIINKNIKDIDSFKPEDFNIENYIFHPYMKIPVAV